MKKLFAILLALTLVAAALNVPAVAEAIPTGKSKTVVTLSQKGTVTLSVGETMQMTATVTPNAAVVWSSRKESVATVDATGKVTAHREGTTTITARASGKTAKVKVKVVDPNKPTGIKISQGQAASVDVGDTLQLGTTLSPAGARATLTWKSSKPKVAIVDENGKVTPVAEGKTRITVTTHNKKKASITVTVVDPFKPTGLTLSQGSSTMICEGDTLELSVGFVPATAKGTLMWKSSKSKVATVDSTGKVTAIGKGKATITVQAANNKKAKATIRITVQEGAPFTHAKDLYPYLGKPVGTVMERFGFEYVREKDDKYGHYYTLRTKNDEVYLESRGDSLEASIIDDIFIFAKDTDYNFRGVFEGMRHDQAKAILEKDGWTSLGEVGEELYAYTRNGAYLSYQVFTGHEVEGLELSRRKGEW